ncbi:hypothetical protein PENTCL1PPCAC_5799, partial [Pristionchus entomophagus]
SRSIICMAEGKKKKKVPQDEEPDPGSKIASAGSWILYPLTGGIHIDLKCTIICYCEVILSFIFGILGVCSIYKGNDITNGFIQIVNCIFLLCLFIEVFFGYRYRSPALLYLHTVQCVFAALMIVMASMFSLVLIEYADVTGKWIRQSISDMQATEIAYCLILLTLGIASYSRARDLIKMHREYPLNALRTVNRRLRRTAGIIEEE